MQRAPRPTLLLTRPAEAAARFAAAVTARHPDLAVLVAPLIEIRPLPFPAGLPAAALVFTSAEGARVFAAGDPRRGLPAFCVGAETARAARRLGFAARAAGADAASLVAALLSEQPVGPLLHVRGRHTRGEVVPRLLAAGLPAAEVVVYDQQERPLDPGAAALLRGPAPVLWPLFSPRSAAIAALAAAGAAAPLLLAALSAPVAEAWREAGGPPPARLELAVRPDAAAMLEALERLLAAAPCA